MKRPGRRPDRLDVVFRLRRFRHLRAQGRTTQLESPGRSHLRKEVIPALQQRKLFLVYNAIFDLLPEPVKAQKMLLASRCGVLSHRSLVNHERPVTGLSEQQFSGRLVQRA